MKMNPITCDSMINSIARLVLAPGAPRCKGWNPNDSTPTWHSAPIDYCHGFRLFAQYADAVEYAEGLDTPFLLMFDQVAQRWAVEPLDGAYGS